MRTAFLSLTTIVVITLTLGTSCFAVESVQQPSNPQQEKATLALKTYELLIAEWKFSELRGHNAGEQINTWSLRTAQAEAELAKDQTSRAEAYSKHFKRMTRFHDVSLKKFKVGLVGEAQILAARYYTLEAAGLLKKCDSENGTVQKSTKE